MLTHFFIEETPDWRRRTSIIFRVSFEGERKTRGKRALQVTRDRRGEEKIIDMYMFMHTSVLFHHINDAIVNRTRRNNLQSCGKNYFMLFESVYVRGGGGYSPLWSISIRCLAALVTALSHHII